MASREQAVIAVQTVDFEGKRLTLGRDQKNGVVLADPNVSRFHAELVRDDDGTVELVDLGSRNGTRLNGDLITRVRLKPGAEIGIGPFQIVFDGSSITARDDRGSLRLDAADVTMKVGEKTDPPAHFALDLARRVGGDDRRERRRQDHPAEGASGRDKAHRGPHHAERRGSATRLTDVGYVPQDEIVHRLLDVDEALRYAARLRLPQDVSDEEIDAAVGRVLGELSLQEHADTRIGSLSGGQRKRTGVAAELLSRPSVLFLDEPTTGLDPGLETQMMQLLRELSRGGRAVAVVTHATKNLALCDRVVVMGRGGYLTFDGPPDRAVSFFEAGDSTGFTPPCPSASRASGRSASRAPASMRFRRRRRASQQAGRAPAAERLPSADRARGALPEAVHARPQEHRAPARPGAGTRPVRCGAVRERAVRPPRRLAGRRGEHALPDGHHHHLARRDRRRAGDRQGTRGGRARVGDRHAAECLRGIQAGRAVRACRAPNRPVCRPAACSSAR